MVVDVVAEVAVDGELALGAVEVGGSTLPDVVIELSVPFCRPRETVPDSPFPADFLALPTPRLVLVVVGNPLDAAPDVVEVVFPDPGRTVELGDFPIVGGEFVLPRPGTVDL